ncbi:hypothetical protein SH611_03800 [Geminicoccaceae bacterium 1502E]|nr:hypothetical protein [Geminicoccaceae bacterium 1502E]
MPGGNPRASLFPAFVALLLGAVLLVVGVPRLMGELALLPGNQAAGNLYAGLPVTKEGRERLARSRAAAAAWIAGPRLDRDLGMAALTAARAPGVTPEQAGKALGEAVARFTSSLQHAPADPYVWAFLSLAHAQRRDLEPAIEALTLAHVVGRGASELAVLRSTVSMAAWPWLNPVLKVAAGEDFVAGLKRNGPALAEVALAAGFADMVRRRLASEPVELRQAFDLYVAEKLCDASFRGSGACAL